ncbi:unnamed protein product [Parnassius apollo]|uniref:(apollo) hypothetical protein n=1 Tax=Parnassius apollo TaxID=110799 RepID=A0A8S3WNW1_PARAO|nr:unnamed protein product [Parnassius apollo]
MGNRKRGQRKPSKKKVIEVGCKEKCEAGPSAISRKTHSVEKSRQISNNASMKLFQYDSSSRPSTPDPFSDDGEYGSDNDYDPGYDDNTDSTSTVSDHTKQREKKQLKKRSKDNATRSHGKRNSESSVSSSSDSDDRTEGFSECTDVCDSDDNEDDTNSISAESSDESIFDSRKRKKKGQSSSLGSRYKKPKIASADQSTDTMSLDSEALLNNIENLESSSVQLDPAVLENISIYSHIEGSHSHTNPQIQGAEDDHAAAAAEVNPAPANLRALELDAAAQHHSPGSPAPDPAAAEGNPAHDNLPALDLDVAAQHRSPSSPALDREAVEGNPAPDNLPALYLDAAAQRHLLQRSPSSPALSGCEGIPPSNYLPCTWTQRCSPGSPAPDPAAAERNPAPVNLSALYLDAVEQRRTPGSPVSDPTAAEENPTPSNLPALDLDAATQCRSPSSSASDREAAEENPAPANLPALDWDATTQCRSPSSSAPPELNATVRYPTPASTLALEVVAERGLSGSPVPERDAAETNSAPTSPSALDREAFVQRNPSICHVLDPEAAERNSVPDTLPEISPATNCRPSTPPLINYDWEHTNTDIPSFEFDESSAGVQFEVNPAMTVMEIFDKILNPNIVDYIVTCTNTKDNPKDIIKKKLKKNQHVWVRKNKVYVSKWVDKRPLLMVTTSVHPRLVEIQNRFQQRKIKPAEVAEYNQHMSGVDRADQMISYYSSPRKSIRWYKKVMFHLLDVAVWNSFFIFKKYCQANCDFLLFREELIRRLLDLPADLTAEQVILARSKYDNRIRANLLPLPVSTIDDDVGSSRVHGHWPEKIPVQEGSNKTSKYLKCKMCTKKKVRRETCLRCKGCPEKPALCALCFEEWHKEV